MPAALTARPCSGNVGELKGVVCERAELAAFCRMRNVREVGE